MKVLKFTSLLVALVVATVATSVTPAAAQNPEIIQKDCDTLSFNPPRVRVTFAVVNLGQVPVCSIHLTPIPSGPFPPCEIFECSVPDSTWGCGVTPDGGASWQTVPPNCIAPFDKVEGFDFIIDPPYCCYRVSFDDPNGQIFFTDTVCFQCESPVAALPTTWGNVKARYR
jgi:hypothetical protein